MSVRLILFSVLIFTIMGCKRSEITPPISEIDSPQALFEVDTLSLREFSMNNLTENSSTFQWDFGDGNESEEIDPTHFYTQAGTYEILLTASRGELIDVASFEITINPLRNDFKVEEIGNGRYLFLPDTNGDSLNWKFGDGTISFEDTVEHTYEMGGSYVVTLFNYLKQEEGDQLASDSIKKNLNVIQPEALFTWERIDKFQVLFTNQSTDQVSSTWYINNSEGQQRPNEFIYDFGAEGTYSVKLVISNDVISDSVTSSITIIDNVVAQFNVNEIQNGEYQLINTSQNAEEYTWDFGNEQSTSAETPSNVEYMEGGDFEIELIAENRGFLDIASYSLTVIEPSAGIGWRRGDNFEVDFQNLSTQFNTPSKWFLASDEAIEKTGDFTHDFEGAGTYPIKLVVFNGALSDTAEVSFTLTEEIELRASFEVTEIQNGEYHLKNTSANADTYLWDFGNSQTSSLETPPAAEYIAGGNYQIKLTVSKDGESDEATYDLTVTQPTAAFTYEILDISGNKDEYRRVSLTNQSTNATGYEWQFGDSNISTTESPTHDYASDGTYNLVLTARDGFVTNEISQSIQIRNWTELNDDPGFERRSGHTVQVFKNSVYMIGGTPVGSETVSDIWIAPVGDNWAPVASNLDIEGGITNSCACVFNDRLWILGGRMNNNASNRVFSSTNGADWTESTVGNKFTATFYSECEVLNDELFVFIWKGNSAGNDLEVWSSADGDNWILKSNPNIQGEFNIGTAVFDNKLWVIGGQFGNSTSSEIWNSSDGVTWNLVTNSPDFGPKRSHNALVFQNRLWVLGGMNLDVNLAEADVWSSSDGITWREEISLPETKFSGSGATNFSATVLSNHIIVVGGDGGIGNDIWRY